MEAVDLAGLLETDLATYAHVPGLVELVRRGVGADDGASLVGQLWVSGYVLQPRDDVFACYVAVPAGLAVVEMNLEGATLTVWVPRSRIARVVELRAGDETRVTVELDADQRRIVLDSESLGSRDDAGAVRHLGRIAGGLTPAVYEIVGAVDDVRLAGLARVLRH
jgi:hypothetical protein